MAFIDPPQADVIDKILRHCDLWRCSAARAPPGGDGREGAGRSDREPKELTYVDMDTFLSNF